MKTHTFASDNYSTIHPEVLNYLRTIITTHAPSYGEDDVTKAARALFRQHFGSCSVLFVTTGTAANIISLSLLLERRYEAIITTAVSHIFEEETGALATHSGAQIFPVPHANGKLELTQLKKEVQLRKSLEFHSALPKVVSIASTTEYGTFYTTSEVKALATYCHENGLYLHMDGCRLANTLAALGCSAKEYVKNTGVDILSFGGAKNGLMNAEAVVIFNAPKTDFLRLQKQSLQLTSKMRYVAGQFVPYLTNNLYLELASHTNTLARQLSEGLANLNIILTHPTSTDQVFCRLPEKTRKKLRAAGHEFYDWNSPNEVRFVTSWDNTETEVKLLFKAIGASL